MTRALRQTLRCRRGFTLAETMAAILLMSFVGLIVTGGISMSARVYGRITQRSNAELLLSTTLLELRDELDRVEEVTLGSYRSDWKAYPLEKYRSSNVNWRKLATKMDLNDPPAGIYIVPDKGYIDNTVGTPQLLVSEAAATDELYATYDKILFESDGTIRDGQVHTAKNGVFKVKNLRVCNKEGETLATTGSTDYTIRALESERLYPSSIFEKKNGT